MTCLPIVLYGCSIIAWIWSVRGGGEMRLTTPFVHLAGVHHRAFEIRVNDGTVGLSTTGWFETQPGGLETILGVRSYWPRIYLRRYDTDRPRFLSLIFDVQPGETVLSPGIGVGKRRGIAVPLWTSTMIFGFLAWYTARRERLRRRR